MAATTIEKLIEYKGALPVRRNPEMKAAVKCLKGTIVGIDSAGRAMPGGLLAAGFVRAIGVAQQTADNSSGAAGDIRCEVACGIFGPFKNSATTDEITDADVQNDCYVVDNQTVAKTSGTSTRGIAGKVEQVTSAGVYVRFV
jgi:hypothetical protein